MSEWLMWVLFGGALCIAELFSGTFYLLLLGVAAFAAAGGAWLGLASASAASTGCSSPASTSSSPSSTGWPTSTA